MKLATARFGEIVCAAEDLLVFPEGIPGLAPRRFVLVDAPESPGAAWLQSVEDPELALLTVDPVALEVPFAPRHKPAETEVVRPNGEDPAALEWRLVAFEDEEGALALNHFAPIVVHRAVGLAMQLFLVGSGFAVRSPWPAPALVE